MCLKSATFDIVQQNRFPVDFSNINELFIFFNDLGFFDPPRCFAVRDLVSSAIPCAPYRSDRWLVEPLALVDYPAAKILSEGAEPPVSLCRKELTNPSHGADMGTAICLDLDEKEKNSPRLRGS
jgi:hypothetical protein